ncbi:MAG TPA: P-II family nitrogen regulator [Capsulimonadaceae bacterium]
MKKVIAIIRPMRLEAVKAALAEEADLTGITVTDVRGCGRNDSKFGGIYRGHEYLVTLPPKVKLEMIVTNEQADLVVDTIVTYARTGEEGDGKIFVIPMGDVIRIRTGDRGDSAVL